MLKRKYLYLLLIPQFAFAFDLNSLWLNNNQQGTQLMKQGKYAEAAQKFDDSNWKATAYYKAGQYDQAYAEYSKDTSARGYYNQGNALAQQHKYQDAIDAYHKSLEIDKNNQDAKDNIELLKKLMDQDKKDQEKNKDDQNKQDQDNKQKDKDQKDDKQQSDQSQNKDKSDNSKDKQSDQNKSEQNSDKNDKQDNKQNNNQQNQQDKQQSQNPADKDKKDAKPEQNQQANQVDQQKNDDKKDKQASASAQMMPEQKQEQQMKAILSQIPDDPGGLLRNKFLRDYQNQQGYGQ